MALTILEALPDAARYDIRILATDIDPVILERAKRGVYAASAIEPVPARMRERSVRPAGAEYALSDEVLGLVSFRELNLMKDWPMKGRFQAIFCRNVAIYFELETQDRLWGRFAPLLTPDGRLYVGHSERVGDDRYEPSGQTAYRLRSARA